MAQAASAIGKELQGSFPTTPLEVGALNDQVEQTIVQERLLENLAGGFGVLGLLLACVGLYGITRIHRGSADQRDRYPHGAGGRRTRGHADGSRACAQTHRGRCTRGIASGVDRHPLGAVDALRAIAE